MSLTDPKTANFGPQLVFNLKFQVLEEFSKIVNFCLAQPRPFLAKKTFFAKMAQNIGFKDLELFKIFPI